MRPSPWSLSPSPTRMLSQANRSGHQKDASASHSRVTNHHYHLSLLLGSSGLDPSPLRAAWFGLSCHCSRLILICCQSFIPVLQKVQNKRAVCCQMTCCQDITFWGPVSTNAFSGCSSCMMLEFSSCIKSMKAPCLQISWIPYLILERIYQKVPLTPQTLSHGCPYLGYAGSSPCKAKPEPVWKPSWPAVTPGKNLHRFW